jgi:hypothetical protein
MVTASEATADPKAGNIANRKQPSPEASVKWRLAAGSLPSCLSSPPDYSASGSRVRERAALRRALGRVSTAAAAEPNFLCHRRASRRIGRRRDRVVRRQLPAGVIRRGIEAVRDPQMTPERPAAKPAFEADHQDHSSVVFLNEEGAASRTLHQSRIGKSGCRGRLDFICRAECPERVASRPRSRIPSQTFDLDAPSSYRHHRVGAPAMPFVFALP